MRMMKMFKFGFLSFIFHLISFSAFSSIVDGEGAGVDSGEGADNSNEGGNDDSSSNDSDSTSSSESEVDTALSSDENTEIRTIIQQNNERELIAGVENDIITRIPEFKSQAVVDGLRELHKTDPKKAAFYNASPAGWEMYHRDHLSSVASGDDVNSGSHSGSGGDFDDSLAKARGGDKKSVKSVLASSRA